MSGISLPTKLKTWARGLKREIAVLWFAIRDPATPWYAKAFGFVIIGYAISPIDLIPDFIPILGYLDDIILLPLGLALLRRLIPEEVMEQARSKAAELGETRLMSRTAGFVVAALWLLILVAIVLLVLGHFATGRKS